MSSLSCVVSLTLLAGLGVVLVLFDGEVQRAVLVGHEKLAEDGVLCRGGSGTSSSAVTGSCTVAAGGSWGGAEARPRGWGRAGGCRRWRGARRGQGPRWGTRGRGQRRHSRQALVLHDAVGQGRVVLSSFWGIFGSELADHSLHDLTSH